MISSYFEDGDLAGTNTNRQFRFALRELQEGAIGEDNNENEGENDEDGDGEDDVMQDEAVAERRRAALKFSLEQVATVFSDYVCYTNFDKL